MAKKKTEAVKKTAQRKEVSRKKINGVTVVFFDDGTSQILIDPVELNSNQTSELFTPEEEDEEDEEDEEEEDEEEEDELTGEDLAKMDFEELEDLCDNEDLDTDPDDFDEEEIEKLRKAVAKELNISLPSKKKSKK